MSAAPRIAIHEFKTAIEVDPTDPENVREVDWVTYGAVGSRDRSTTTDRVSRLECVVPSNDMQNPAIRAAAMRWAVIGPAYEAWKAGKEAPVEGTPLAVLNSVPTERADYLRSRGIKTIEDLAEMTDTHIERMKITGLRTNIADARRYLEASDSRKVSATLAQKDKEIANQQAQLTDQQEQMRAMAQKMDELAEMVARQNMAKADDGQSDEAPAKRGPGRPRKDEAKAEDAAAA